MSEKPLRDAASDDASVTRGKNLEVNHPSASMRTCAPLWLLSRFLACRLVHPAALWFFQGQKGKPRKFGEGRRDDAEDRMASA